MSNTSIKEERRLKSADDFAMWDRAVQAALGQDGRINHIVQDRSALAMEVVEDYPYSLQVPLPMEIAKRRAAERQLERDCSAAFSTIYTSLSETIQNTLPADLSSFLDPDPKGLYNHIKETYGAKSGTRQGELWARIWGARIEENEDPLPQLVKIRSAMGEIIAGAKALSIEEFSASVCAHAALQALPSSYGLLASTFVHNTITLDQVIERVTAEHRRREQKGEAVNEHGLLATRSTSKPKLAPKKTSAKWCDNHLSSGHTTSECRGVSKGWLPPSEFRKKKEEERKKENGLAAVSKAEEGREEMDNGVLSVEAGLNATHLALLAQDKDAIILDTGATNPFIKDKHLLSNLVQLATPIPVYVGNGKPVFATHTGRLAFKKVFYDNSYYVPGMAYNLLAAQRLGDHKRKLEWRFSKTQAQLVRPDGTILLAGSLGSAGFWTTDEQPVRYSSPTHLALSATERAHVQDNQLLTWHQRLGHVDMKQVWELGVDGKLEGAPWSGQFKRVECMGCLKGKAKRLASSSNTDRALKPLVNVSMDLWGPAAQKSRQGYIYFLTCYDDHSKYVHVTPLKSKSDATTAIGHYTALVENQLDRTIKTIRTDQGGEFMSGNFATWCQSKGIEHATTPTAAHNQNSRVERMHLTLLNDVRSMLADSDLPLTMWVDALQHAVYTRNRIPNKTGLSPLELFQPNSGKRVDYNHMRAFGSHCFYRVTEAQSKLLPRARAGRIIGYGNHTTAYTILDSDARRVFASRDVHFTPQSGHNQTTTILAPSIEQEPETIQARPAVLIQEAELEEDDEEFRQMEEPGHMEDQILRETPEPVRGWQYEPFDREAAPSPEPQGLEEVIRPRRILRSGRALIASECNILDHALSAQTINNPENYQQARQSSEWPEWQMAMVEEMGKMDKYGVWEVVPKIGQRTLSGKWVYTRKLDGETGKPKAYKARFVVRGFQQQEGRDYGELFASVVHKDSMRVFLSIVNHLDLECDQVDIIGAFLNGEIDRELYVDPPQGSEIPAGHVLKLRKSLYGLKQSPRLFNQKLNGFLKAQGLTPSMADPCIYIRNDNGIRLMVSVHVDDQLIACNNRAALDQFKKDLNATFECKDQGPIGYFLGINVYRDRPNKRMYLSQEHYLEGLLERFGEVGSPCKTSLPSNWKPTSATDEEHEAAKDKPFPQLAGSVLYAATITRPDLAYPASVLCRYISKWSLDHWKAAKHLLRYIRGTSDLCLTFDAHGGKRMLLGWADADWGGCMDTRRSTTGYVFSTYGGIVAWKSKRQPTVALSTTQAELLASTDAGKEAIWLRQLLADLQLGPADGDPTTIKNDNMGAVQLAKHQHGFKVNKAFDLRAQWIREHQDMGVIKLEHVDTQSNRADLLTKPFTAERLRQLQQLAGLTRR
jgi:hypothetical protein